MKRLVTILALGVLVSACSSTPPGPPPPPPFSPVGEYTVTIEVAGQAIAGTVTIQDTDDGLTGSLMAAESDGTLSAFNRGQARGFATELIKSHGELLADLDIAVALLKTNVDAGLLIDAKGEPYRRFKDTIANVKGEA